MVHFSLYRFKEQVILYPRPYKRSPFPYIIFLILVSV
jgi:hypothetical protein